MDRGLLSISNKGLSFDTRLFIIILGFSLFGVRKSYDEKKHKLKKQYEKNNNVAGMKGQKWTLATESSFQRARGNYLIFEQRSIGQVLAECR